MKNRKLHPRLSTLAQMAGEVYDAATRTASRMIYQVAYALALTFGNVSPRRKKALAARFAAKAQENAQKSTPAAISLFLNAFVLWMVSTVAIRPRFEKKGTEISLVIGDGFFTDTTPTAPPAGGGGGGNSALDQTLAEVTKAITNPAAAVTSTTTDILAMVTTAPSTFEIPTPSTPRVNHEALANAIASLPSTPSTGEGTGTSGTGTGTGIGEGEGSGTGPGTGTGQGGGNGSGTGQGTGSGNALFGGGVGKGHGQGAPSGSSVRNFANWNVVVIVDLSDFIQGETTVSPEDLPVWFQIKEKTGIWGINPIRESAFFLPAMLAQRNVVLDAIPVDNDNLDHRARSGTGYASLGYITHKHVGVALQQVLVQYAGRENTCIVIGSEFEYQTSKEVLDSIETQAKEAGLPIFFVSLAGKPDHSITRMARNTGGDYLGYLDGRTARGRATRQPLITLRLEGDENKGSFWFEPTPHATEFTLPAPTEEAPPLPKMEDREEMVPGQEGYIPPQ